MPTQIDIALAEGKRRINASIEKAAAAKDIDEHDVSPLFRDEARRQEMAYLDTFLSKPHGGDLPLSIDDNRVPDKSLYTTQNNTSSTLNYGLNYEPFERSRISKLMGPNNYDDTAESNAVIQPNSSNVKQNKGESISQKQSYNDTFGVGKINETNQLPIRTIKAQHKKRKFKLPIPSTNKRRLLNHRLVQKARLKSLHGATNIIKFVNRCTRNVKSISHLMRGSISSAVKTMYGMLEDKKNDTVKNHEQQDKSKSQSTGDTGVRVPPTKVFMFTSKWPGSQMIRDQAKYLVQKSISGKK